MDLIDAIAPDYTVLIDEFASLGSIHAKGLNVHEVQQISFDIYRAAGYTGKQARIKLEIPSDKYLSGLVDYFPVDWFGDGEGEGVSQEYVVGWSSHVNFRGTKHIPMFDVDMPTTIKYSGDAIVIISDRFNKVFPGGFTVLQSSFFSFHVIGYNIVSWDEYAGMLQDDDNLVDKKFVRYSMDRRYGTLRVSASVKKPMLPVTVYSVK